MKKLIITLLKALLIVLLTLGGYLLYLKYANENKVLKQMISRLEADSRIAEVLVTAVKYDELKNKRFTTIKFLEFDASSSPMDPRYFTFSGNIIQFQSLVMRFDDMHIRHADKFRGKSAYIFLKVFMLDGKNTQEYEITGADQVPDGYRISYAKNEFEEQLWQEFWKYALDPEKAKSKGIKNAQIEAPGTMFIPGMLYTIKIEHDGGIRIDASQLPEILKGEHIPI
ncbi:MAG: hypothetical protein ABH843_08015 [Candidatus Omnitrophota bacterium]